MTQTHLPTLAACALLASALVGCASNEPPLAMVHYPVTYEVPVGGSAIPHVGNPNLDISATQDVAVQPGKPLYCEFRSPVPLTVYLYERVGAAPNANLLTHLQVPANQRLRKRFIPPTSSVEFLFADQEPGVPGTLQFTLSDEPLAGDPMQPPPTFVGH